MEKFCEDIGVEPENVGFFHNTNHTFTGLDLVPCTALRFSKQSCISCLNVWSFLQKKSRNQFFLTY